MKQTSDDPLSGVLTETMPPFLGAALSYSPNTTLDWHHHETGQIIHAVSGTLQLWAADQFVLLPPTMAMWVPPAMRHRLVCKTQTEMRTLYVRPDALDLGADHARVFSVSDLLRALLLAAMPEKIDTRDTDRSDALFKLLAHELSASPVAALHLPLPTDPRLMPMIDAALSDPGEIGSIANWAAAAPASRKTVERLFIQGTGLSPSQWLKRALILESIKRLSEGQPVGTIALDLGYATASAFTYMFKRALGVPPSKFVLKS